MCLKCEICNEFFKNCLLLSKHITNIHDMKTKTYYDKFFKKEEIGLCKTCKKETVFINLGLGYREYCSKSCVSKSIKKKNTLKLLYNNPEIKNKIIEKRKQTLLRNYGVENPMQIKEVKDNLKIYFNTKYGVNHPSQIQTSQEKKRQTFLNKYGVENPNQSELIKEKKKQTFLRNYGVENPNQSELIKEKKKQTFLRNYGVENPLSSKDIRKKIKQTMLKRYGVKNFSQSKNFKENIGITLKKLTYEKILKTFNYIPLFTFEDYCKEGAIGNYKWRCKKCDTIFENRFNNGFILHCPICEPNPRSKPQNELFNFLSRYNIQIKQNSRSFFDNKIEVDLLLKDQQIGIEFNGNFYHSEVNGNKNRNYHLIKTNIAKDKNIKLIHIFEDEWLFKNKIIKNRLKSLLKLNKYKIYGRDCIIQEIDTKLKNKFLNKYHLQGQDKSQIYLGSFYRNRLVAVMTFSKQRKALGLSHKENYWELSRFVTVGGFTVIGIASKLLKYFEVKYKPKQIITYADIKWSMGKLYTILGFTQTHQSKPNYWYLDKGNFLKRYHRFNFQKHKLSKLLTNFDSNLSEWENMKNNGYDRIWDCGNYVFVKKYPA